MLFGPMPPARRVLSGLFDLTPRERPRVKTKRFPLIFGGAVGSIIPSMDANPQLLEEHATH